jgi:hypothetical protein
MSHPEESPDFIVDDQGSTTPTPDDAIPFQTDVTDLLDESGC